VSLSVEPDSASTNPLAAPSLLTAMPNTSVRNDSGSEGLMAQLRIPTPVAIRDVWPSEPGHFTPWMAEHLGLLDILDLGPLKLLRTEYVLPGTGRALDILAESPVGRVAIENQYGRADHDHLTRGLAYAVGLGAVALVVIAEDHLGEFRAVAGYLNEIVERSTAESQIRVYLVELAADKVEEYLIPRLTLIERPNAWVAAAAASVPPINFATTDEFIESAPEAVQNGFRSVIEWWANDPERGLRIGNSNVVLDRPHPGTPGRPLSHLVLNLNGTYTVQRGYLIECGAVAEGQTDAFDEFLHRTFPSLAWTPKKYFLTAPGFPSASEVEELVDWLDNHKF
jgi:hypothetical protein